MFLLVSNALNVNRLTDDWFFTLHSACVCVQKNIVFVLSCSFLIHCLVTNFELLFISNDIILIAV